MIMHGLAQKYYLIMAFDKISWKPKAEFPQKSKFKEMVNRKVALSKFYGMVLHICVET